MAENPHVEMVDAPDFENEEVIPFWSDDKKALAGNTYLSKKLGGRHFSRSTLFDWANKGFPVRDGSNRRIRVPGETRQVRNSDTGKIRRMQVTTKEALDRFLEVVGPTIPGKGKAMVDPVRRQLDEVE